MSFPYSGNAYNPALTRFYRRGLHGIAITAPGTWPGGPDLSYLQTPVAAYKNGVAAALAQASAPPPPPAPAPSSNINVPLIGAVPDWAVLGLAALGAWALYEHYR
jgi:hypothetical protein